MGFSLQRLLLLQNTGFRALGLQQLQLTGLVALWLEESSWTRNQMHVPCTSSWLLNHWATREAHEVTFWFRLPFRHKPHSFQMRTPAVVQFVKLSDSECLPSIRWNMAEWDVETLKHIVWIIQKCNYSRTYTFQCFNMLHTWNSIFCFNFSTIHLT